MLWRASFVLLALVVACGGSSEGGGGTAGSGGAGVGGQGGTGGSELTCVDSVCSCDEAGIRAAISEGGGPFTFDCDGPTTVVTEAEVIIDNDVILDGEGNLTVDGNEAHRVFSVPENVTAELQRLTVTKGRGSLAGWIGGGIYNRGRLTLTHSTVSDSATNGGGNGSGGGIYNGGTLTVTHSTVSGNTSGHGGGVSNEGTATLISSTVSGNRAERLGGGIDNSGGTLTLISSTVSGNTAALNTGGIRNVGTLTVVASTLSGNTTDDGSASIESHGTLTLTHSLVDGDCNLDVGPGASVTSNGYTIESPGDTCGFDQPTDQVNVSAADLKLGSLQDNGGPTMTHALGAGSVSIDAIPGPDCEADTDQRGEPRPGGAMCDVGSFEVQP
jgi:hypothetical protein